MQKNKKKKGFLPVTRKADTADSEVRCIENQQALENVQKDNLEEKIFRRNIYE